MNGPDERPDETPDPDDRLEELLGAALSARADQAPPAAGAWERIDAERRHTPNGRRFGPVVPLLAVAAAVVVAVVAAAVLRPPGSVQTVTPATDPSRPTTTVAPVDGTTGTTGTSPVAAPAGIRAIDLGNSAVPRSVCGEPGDRGVVQLSDGVGGPAPPEDRPGATYPTEPGVQLMAGAAGVTYLDVDGDGSEEAAVVLQCRYWGSDSFHSGVVVMADRSGVAVPLATINDAGVEHRPLEPGVTDDRSPVAMVPGAVLGYNLAEAVSVRDGRLVVRWAARQVASPVYETTVTYAFGDGRFHAVGDTGPTLTDGQRWLDERRALWAVRDLDLRNIVLPLATGALCSTELGSAGTVRDAQLVAGEAEVVDAGGARVGSVRIVDVRYGFALGRGAQDAVVRLRCEGPLGARTAVAVIRENGGRAELAAEVTSGSNPSATAEDAFVADDNRVIVRWTTPTDGSGWIEGSRWTGDRFVRG